MLKLDTQPRPPVRIALPDGAHIDFKPLTTSGLAAGRAMARDVVVAGGAGAVAGVSFSIACARWGAVAWDGVGDEAGEPLELTPDNVQLLLEQNEAAFDAVEKDYIWPALGLETEKNGSAPARVGTSRARRKTTPAGKARGAAGPTAKAAAATGRSAPTKSSARKRSKASSPGAS